MLENNQIKLRSLEPEDIELLYLWENDTNLWQNGNTLAPWSRYSLRKYIEESYQHIYDIKQQRLMVVWKENNDAIGTIDIFNFDPFHERAEVGILIEKKYRNKGIGEQVLFLLQEYAFDFLKIKQLYAYIPEENDISLRLFQRCGYLISGKLFQWLRAGNTFQDVYILQLIDGNK